MPVLLVPRVLVLRSAKTIFSHGHYRDVAAHSDRYTGLSVCRHPDLGDPVC